ncbi:hypothetical protein T07_1306, partial [Trichinella nelsoni]
LVARSQLRIRGLQYWLSVLPYSKRDELGSVDEPS